MERTEAEACLRILLAVARADGDIADDEARALEVLAGYHGDPDAAPAAIDLERECRRLRTAELRRTTFDAAVALAAVDGRTTPEEHALLERLRTALEVPTVPELAKAEGAWREQLREPLRKIADAEVGFLHSLASERDKLSDEAYLALVEDLRSTRTKILADALHGSELS